MTDDFVGIVKQEKNSTGKRTNVPETQRVEETTPGAKEREETTFALPVAGASLPGIRTVAETEAKEHAVDTADEILSNTKARGTIVAEAPVVRVSAAKTPMAEEFVADSKQQKQKRTAKVIKSWRKGLVPVFLTLLIAGSVGCYLLTQERAPFEQLYFHILVPMTGAGFNPVKTYVLPVGAFVVAGCLGYVFLAKKVMIPRKFKAWKVLSSTLALLLVTVILALHLIGFFTYVKAQSKQSSSWERFYVEPAGVALQFPPDAQKKNMIYIVLESFESTYGSQQNGGAMPHSIMPHLEEWALDPANLSFSHTQQLGGATQFSGMTWTAASMVCQMGGIPLHVPTEDVNAFRRERGQYLPGSTMLGDILREEGYYLEMMMGSTAEFAARDNLYETHGQFQMYDYRRLVEEKLIPEDYFVFWGVEDVRLFEIAKQRLTTIAQQEQPFFFSLLTVDTHFPDGYQYEEREKKDEQSYANAIAWSDHDLNEFISWIKEQPFYKDTTIVLVGDHLSMEKTFFQGVDPQYDRRIYNVVLNPQVSLDRVKRVDREFTMLDFYPTTLALLGVKIPGDRLAYGTNLLSVRWTLVEELGTEKAQEMFESGSSFYDYMFHERQRQRSR